MVDEERPDKEEVKEVAAEVTECNETPLLRAFLEKWDRGLHQDRRTYGVKLCFAGAESKKVRDGLHRIGVKHILVSYFYLKNWLKKTSVQEIAEDMGRFDFVLLDSGAFTFMHAFNEGKKLGIDLQGYADEYFEDLKRIGQLFARCAEVDVYTLGHDYMERKKHEMLDAGIPIFPAVQGEPLSKYEGFGWFDDYPYISVGSMLNAAEYTGYLSQLISICKKRGVVVHGFGATDANTVTRSQYYSVDSTSWLGGSRFGNTMIFQNGRIRHYDKTHKDVRNRYKQRLVDNGIDWDKIEADNGPEVDLMNALAWKQWADYVRFNAQRSYWLNADEKDAALTLKSKAFNAEGLIDRKTSIQRATARRLTEVSSAEYDDRQHEMLHCDSCFMSGRCPRYKDGESCGYDVNIRLQSKEDLQKALQIILEAQYGRTMTGILFEKIQGGIIDANVSRELNQFLRMVQDVKAIFDPREELTIKAKGGKGTVAQALAAVFAPSGTGKSGSGSTPTQRAASKVEEVTVIDAEAVPSDKTGESYGRKRHGKKRADESRLGRVDVDGKRFASGEERRGGQNRVEDTVFGGDEEETPEGDSGGGGGSWYEAVNGVGASQEKAPTPGDNRGSHG